MTPHRIRALVALHGQVGNHIVQDIVGVDPRLSVEAVLDGHADGRGHEADVLLVICGAPSDAVLATVAQEAASPTPLPVVVVCGGSPNGFVREVLQAGADDIVVASSFEAAGAQVLFAIEKALSRKATPARPDQAGDQLICVLGPKGGTGKTLTASNLAVALAAEGSRVVLVDLDLQFGDIALVMGVTPDRTSFDLATSGGTLDGQKVDAFLATHESGVRLLLAPTRPDQAAAVTPDFLRELYPVLRAEFDYVVVDTPPGFTPEVICTIDAASSVCLVATLDMPALKNAKLGAETLELMGYPPDAVRVVLNRSDAAVGVDQADVVTVLGRVPDVLVPSSRDVVRSVNAGTPIVMSAPRSDAGKAYRGLAELFNSHDDETGGGRSRRGRRLRLLARS